MKGGAKMEKPYRYLKKLVKLGSSFYILAPIVWLNAHAKKMKIKEISNVILEVYDDRLVITPTK